eukprot:3012816-Rhodomonas_salina.1
MYSTWIRTNHSQYLGDTSGCYGVRDVQSNGVFDLYYPGTILPDSILSIPKNSGFDLSGCKKGGGGINSDRPGRKVGKYPVCFQ